MLIFGFDVGNIYDLQPFVEKTISDIGANSYAGAGYYSDFIFLSINWNSSYSFIGHNKILWIIAVTLLTNDNFHTHARVFNSKIGNDAGHLI